MRQADIQRNTQETRIRVRIDLDGGGRGQFKTGVPFLDHMLDQIARHGMIDLEVEAEGDLHIDAHHTVEDIGITLELNFVDSTAVYFANWPDVADRRERGAEER